MTTAELSGLRGEVITEDVYGLRGLSFSPDVVFDLGANVGVFAEHARSIFPQALIVCVEPDTENFGNLSRDHGADGRVVLLNSAIGSGNVYRHAGAANGAHESYVTNGLGYPENVLAVSDNLTLVDIPTIMPDALIKKFAPPPLRFILKMDIEGGEGAVFEHQPSLEAIARAEYFAIEVHSYAMHEGLTEETNLRTAEILECFNLTHVCTRVHGVIFRARKR